MRILLRDAWRHAEALHFKIGLSLFFLCVGCVCFSFVGLYRNDTLSAFCHRSKARETAKVYSIQYAILASTDILVDVSFSIVYIVLKPQHQHQHQIIVRDIAPPIRYHNNCGKRESERGILNSIFSIELQMEFIR